MTAKAFSNLHKLSLVMCCARETTESLASEEPVNLKEPGVKFTVTVKDVMASWDIVKQSMHVYKSFKVFDVDIINFIIIDFLVQVSLAAELGEVAAKPNAEDLVFAGAVKIMKIYKHADDNKEVCLC